MCEGRGWLGVLRPNRAAPRLAGRGETQAHVGAPLRHELVEARAADLSHANGCTSLTSVTLPEGLQNCAQCFDDCTSLISITM